MRLLDGIYGPGMVALVEHVERGIVGIHRTWLARDEAGNWRRSDRASLGPIGGGAVRLAPVAPTLMVGEGIETCLAAMQATAMPAWAALSTSGMSALVLPTGVCAVIILADNDASGAGERSAYAAADRWLAEGRRVRIAMPPEPDTDFNDVLLGRSHARNRKVSDVAV
jgi:putative DNA primase/helicase